MSCSDYKSLSEGYLDNTRSHISSNLFNNNLMENKNVENYNNGQLYGINKITNVICNNTMGYWGKGNESRLKCVSNNSGINCVKSNDCSGYYDVYYPDFIKQIIYKDAGNLKKGIIYNLTPDTVSITDLFGRNIIKPESGDGSAMAVDPILEFHFFTPNNEIKTTISNLKIDTKLGIIKGKMEGYSGTGKPINVKVIITYTDPQRIKIHQIVTLSFK